MSVFLCFNFGDFAGLAGAIFGVSVCISVFSTSGVAVASYAAGSGSAFTTFLTAFVCSGFLISATTVGADSISTGYSFFATLLTTFTGSDSAISGTETGVVSGSTLTFFITFLTTFAFVGATFLTTGLRISFFTAEFLISGLTATFFLGLASFLT